VVRTKERLDATARELAADTALALGWTVVLARQLPRGPARRPA